jgi:hypothetical protein
MQMLITQEAIWRFDVVLRIGSAGAMAPELRDRKLAGTQQSAYHSERSPSIWSETPA